MENLDIDKFLDNDYDTIAKPDYSSLSLEERASRGDADTRKIYVNEINTIPGSLSFYLWEAAGLKFPDLMDRLVRLALKRKRDQESKTVSYDSNIFAMGGGVKGAKGAKA